MLRIIETLLPRFMQTEEGPEAQIMELRVSELILGKAHTQSSELQVLSSALGV